MPNSDSSDNGTPDPIELTSNIGTWVAAGLAIIALVGIVGPLLALHAAASDKNRAMNGVQDEHQKYVSRGFRLTRGLRVFRRIRVPNLSPGYIANEPDTAPLVPSLRAALGRWVLKPRDYLPWNSGWAKFSELIEAYEVRDGTDNRLVELCVPKTGGTLEIVNSRTALVVNKHWILLLGLLGRYGERVDKGILQMTGIRRDFEGERASIRRFSLQRKDSGQFDPEPEWVRKKAKHRHSSSWGARSSDISRTSNTSHDSRIRSRETVMAIRRSAYGTITLEETPQPTIYGITGTMQELGRHKGSWSYLTSISFVPHTAREIFRSGIKDRPETSSLQTLFWLAHGFLPCGRTPEGRQRVISLESPGPQFEGLGHLADLTGDWPTYSLQECDDIPISIGTAMQCLGIPEPKVLQFLPVHAATNEKRILEAINSRTRNDDAETVLRHHSVTKREDESSFSSRFKGLRTWGGWVYYSKPSRDHFCAFPKDDLERSLRLILTLDWDDWGYIVWKDQFWISILKHTVDILRKGLSDSALMKSSGLTPHARVFRWQHDQTFYPQKLADHLALDKHFTVYFEKHEILPLRLALGTLYVLDNSLREMTERACSRLCKFDERDNEVEVKNLKERVSELNKRLEEVQKTYWDAKELHEADTQHQPLVSSQVEDSDGKPQERMTYTSLEKNYLDPETLDKFGIDYEPDEASPPPILT
ncbi:hypothetical protein S40285_09497 [Stachybotrys chlorohalonatus IBT 40285]|uniref:Uncharacterized protein n=1 Tax=Stachybotrys chlorohalonatus (strain IBT 40285) TaxID=1283841 RepID=A0A084QX37_STAC4|nr:hypothetical protein S40285_09497 [Stachybotrys chlorohalonata IBT 40285]